MKFRAIPVMSEGLSNRDETSEILTTAETLSPHASACTWIVVALVSPAQDPGFKMTSARIGFLGSEHFTSVRTSEIC